MAKRNKRIQKKKKRKEKIRQSKARRRSINEVYDEQQLTENPPDSFENNIFELLTNESQQWSTEPELESIRFDPTVAVSLFVEGMTKRGVDPETIANEIDAEQLEATQWEVIEELMPALITPENIGEVVQGLQQLEKRWSKDKSKSADIAGVVTVKTMLEASSFEGEFASALSMIGLLQAIAARTVIEALADPEQLMEGAAVRIEAVREALFSGELKLDLFTEDELNTAKPTLIELFENGETRNERAKEIAQMALGIAKQAERRPQMVKAIEAYQENTPALTDDAASVLEMMRFLLTDHEDPATTDANIDELYGLLSAAIMGELRHFVEVVPSDGAM